MLRVDGARAASPLPSDIVWQIDANLDDMSPELCGPASDALFAAGALDVWWTPITMKKGRPALTLSRRSPRRDSATRDRRDPARDDDDRRALRRAAAHRARAHASSTSTTRYGAIPVKVASDGEASERGARVRGLRRRGARPRRAGQAGVRRRARRVRPGPSVSLKLLDSPGAISACEDGPWPAGSLLSMVRTASSRWEDRRTIDEQQLVHRSVHVLLFDRAHRLLVQRRHANKQYPRTWDISVAGHVEESDYTGGPDDDLDAVYAAVAARELDEELGVSAPLALLARFGPEPGVHYEQIQLFAGTSDGPSTRCRPTRSRSTACSRATRSPVWLAGPEPITHALRWFLAWLLAGDRWPR